VTLFNCFVMGEIADDLSSIFHNVREAALTMQQGGGIGHDFSALRPKGALVRSIGADASGPVSFMDVWDAMCRTIMSAGTRRGAMMATLRCDHPDIEAFIEAKSDAQRLRMFNLSVLVSDAFMAAVEADASWDLKFAGTVYRTVRARALWDKIMRATYDFAEPGVIFIDRVNARNNLAYCETIYATNPCGEQPLPPYGACLLGSINLAQLVRGAFKANAALDTARLETLVTTAVRFLDNAIDVSGYPLKAQKAEARAKRRIGLGVTGLADALIMCGLNYGSKAGRRAAESWMRTISHTAYRASARLAREKGAFPLYDEARFLAAPNVTGLDKDVRKDIAKFGIRNGLLTSIAPTGTISMFAGNVSSGIEPVFDFQYRRRILEADGGAREEHVEDYAHRLFRHLQGPRAALPEAFVTAEDLTPQAHLKMQAGLQRHVDSAISKTINCPEDMAFEDFNSIYKQAFDLGLKGCTTYRPNDITGSVLSVTPDQLAQPDAADAKVAAVDAGLVPTLATSLPQAGGGGETAGEVVYMATPLERDAVLTGFTYKLRWPDSDHAIYVTINDTQHNGRRRPFEIFINSKNLEHYAWTVALTRMISAVFRRGGDVSFVVEELKAVFDPRGGQWMDGRYVPSLLAAIGNIIEQHMVRIGFLPSKEESVVSEPMRASLNTEGKATSGELSEPPQMARMRRCPRCSSPGLVHQEGCLTCRVCGFSKCS
jgi:ribonucleoside-diphosphate reductase alpha chain